MPGRASNSLVGQAKGAGFASKAWLSLVVINCHAKTSMPIYNCHTVSHLYVILRCAGQTHG